MPQASEAQRKLMQQWFGGIDDGPPYAFLKARGWTEENGNGMLAKPTPSHNPSIYEVACVLFLRDEWDYDWVHPLYPQLPGESE